MPEAFADHVEALLAQRCCEAIGLARRSGLAVAGFEKVCEAVRAGKAALLLSALDGAEGGRGKIRALGRSLPLAIVLTAAEMGAVFGRDHVVHVALGGGRLSRRLISDAEKLAGFRSGATVDRGVEAAVSPADAARRQYWIEMSDANEQEQNTTEQEQKRPLTLGRSGGRLELRKPVETAQVRQSFSHGRSKTVTVEVRKKRAISPGCPKPAGPRRRPRWRATSRRRGRRPRSRRAARS